MEVKYILPQHPDLNSIIKKERGNRYGGNRAAQKLQEKYKKLIEEAGVVEFPASVWIEIIWNIANRKKDVNNITIPKYVIDALCPYHRTQNLYGTGVIRGDGHKIIPSPIIHSIKVVGEKALDSGTMEVIIRDNPIYKLTRLEDSNPETVSVSPNDLSIFDD